MSIWIQREMNGGSTIVHEKSEGRNAQTHSFILGMSFVHCFHQETHETQTFLLLIKCTTRDFEWRTERKFLKIHDDQECSGYFPLGMFVSSDRSFIWWGHLDLHNEWVKWFGFYDRKPQENRFLWSSAENDPWELLKLSPSYKCPVIINQRYLPIIMLVHWWSWGRRCGKESLGIMHSTFCLRSFARHDEMVGLK